MSKQGKQKKIRIENDKMFTIYHKWLDGLDKKSLYDECKCLFKEHTAEARKEIVEEIYMIAELKQLQENTGVKVINVKEDGTHEYFKQ